MTEFINDIFRYGFLSDAVAACALASVACGIVGTYIVCRRLVFFAGGITHASFGGIGIAYWLGVDPIAGALLFSAASAAGLEAMAHRARIREDSAVGILWSVGMAAGILFITLTPGYAPNLMSFLFGNILTVTGTDITAMTVLDAVLIAVMALFYRPVVYTAFDREYAATQGAPVKFTGYMMMVLTAIAIVLLIKLVGIVLLISLLAMPPVIAGSLTRSYPRIMALAAAITALAAFTGLYISYSTDIPSGAATIIVLAVLLVIVKIAKFTRSKT